MKLKVVKNNHFYFSFAVWGYKHRDASIEADLNKLYDTRPTSTSFVNNDEGRRQHHLASQPALKSQIPDSSIEGGGGAGGVENEEQASSPYFDLNHSGDVTAVLGKTALLNCRVKNIGNKTVSFTKKKCQNKKPFRKNFLLTYLATYFSYAIYQYDNDRNWQKYLF